MTRLPELQLFPWPAALVLAGAALYPGWVALTDLRTEPLIARAHALQNELELDAALKDLQAAAALSPRDPQIQLEIAEASRTMWFYRRTPALKAVATGAFERAGALSPGWASPHYEESVMYAFVEDYPHALTALQAAIDRDPNNAAYWLQQGTYFLLGRNATGAQKAYRHCLALNPTVKDCQAGLDKLGAAAGPS